MDSDIPEEAVDLIRCGARLVEAGEFGALLDLLGTSDLNRLSRVVESSGYLKQQLKAILLSIAEYLWEEEEFGEALRLYCLLYERFADLSDDGTVAAGYGHCLKRIGRIADATRVLEGCIADAEDGPAAWIHQVLGEIYLDVEEFEKAEQTYTVGMRRFAGLTGDFLDVWSGCVLGLAVAQRHLGKRTEALLALTDLVTRDDTPSWAKLAAQEILVGI